MYVRMYVCTYVCMYVRMYVCMYVCMLTLHDANRENHGLTTMKQDSLATDKHCSPYFLLCAPFPPCTSCSLHSTLSCAYSTMLLDSHMFTPLMSSVWASQCENDCYTHMYMYVHPFWVLVKYCPWLHVILYMYMYMYMCTCVTMCDKQDTGHLDIHTCTCDVHVHVDWTSILVGVWCTVYMYIADVTYNIYKNFIHAFTSYSV